MKKYILSYEDKKGNELQQKEIEAVNIKEAEKLRDRYFAEAMINDLYKIKIMTK